MTTRVSLSTAQQLVEQQREWIANCGGNLNGYVANYGAKDDPGHQGDGGEAIYAADVSALTTYEELLDQLRREQGMADTSTSQIVTARYAFKLNTNRMPLRALEAMLDTLVLSINEQMQQPADPDSYKTVTIERR
jgi:hypothetical protein